MTANPLEIRSTIDIAASPEHIWSVLTAFDNYQTWNPFIRGIKVSKLHTGAKLHALVRRPPNGRSRLLSTIILNVTPGSELMWRRKFLMTRLFTAEQAFIIVPNGVQGSHFIQRERYSGFLASFIFRQVKSDTTESFEAMNRALKRVAEK